MTQPPTSENEWSEDEWESFAGMTDAQRRQLLSEAYQGDKATRLASQNDIIGARAAYGSPGVSISGWLATLLGMYLIVGGAYSVFEITNSGKANIINATFGYLEEDKDSLTARTIVFLPTNIILLTAGSGLLALGSIARSSKRSKITNLPE